MGPTVALLADYWRPGWRAGGPITSLGLLVDRSEIPVSVFTRDHDLGSPAPYPGVRTNGWTSVGRDGFAVAYLRGLAGVRWAFRHLRAMRPSIVHINSVHSPVFGIAPLLATRLGLFGSPIVVISPHGELTEASQEHKRWKKRLARPVLRRIIRKDASWHASSTFEAADIERWLNRAAHIIVAPDAPPTPHAGGPTPLEESTNQPTVLFASRIHPIKGLDSAIEVVGQVATPCRFVIAGPIEDESYWARCQGLLKKLPSHVTVDVRGPFEPSDMPSLVTSARILILPTKGENFGQVIAEALSQGCPVALPPVTPWLDYAGSDIGCVSDDEREVATYLETALSEPVEAHKERRRRAYEAYSSWFSGVGDVDVYSLILAEMS